MAHTPDPREESPEQQHVTVFEPPRIEVVLTPVELGGAALYAGHACAVE